MTKTFILPLLTTLFASLLLSCNKDNTDFRFDYDGPCHCSVDNPLQDLQWLHNTAVRFESMRDIQWAKIFICTYDSTHQGFIIDPCVQCNDGMQSFTDCEGNLLGNLGGIAGIPLSTYNIDPNSVREISRNYPDTAATIVGKRWQLQYFLDRETWQEEVPMQNNLPIPFWIQFNTDGTVQAGGINQLFGTYALFDHDHIYIDIHSGTEIYDPSGWEQRMIDALNDATICDIDYYGSGIRIYYDRNTKFLKFTRSTL